MHKARLSTTSLSILFAVALALWEIYFFWLANSHLLGKLEGTLGLFTTDRLGFNLAWVVSIYLTYQLISIPFAVPASGGRFLGVVDGMASLLPLAIVLIVVFGRPHLIGTAERWEAAFLLMFVSAVDLFGGYAFNIALSRRSLVVGSSAAT
jgi:hypothetical protein